MNRDQQPIVKSSADGINIYKLPSLGYEVTDCHLPRGFVTSKKPNVFVLCDSIYCDRTYDLHNGHVLACGHGYHNYCLQKSQFKCFICLGYLEGKIKKNIDVLTVSMTNKLVENKSINRNSENTADDDGDGMENAEEATGNAIEVENLLNHAKITFLEL